MPSFFQDLLASIATHGRNLIAPANDEAGDARALADLCEKLLSETGEASEIAMAEQALSSYRRLDNEGRIAFFDDLASRFGAETEPLNAAIADYLAEPGPVAAQRLHRLAEPRRQELMRHLNQAPSGTADLVAMRSDLQKLLRDKPELALVDADFSHLFQSWFNRGFLVLRQIDWSTPASILERIIRYEAVHEIDSWDDLRRRIEPVDRRCYAFFHPALGEEPLIFVEVALTAGIPGEIAPVLSPDRDVLDAGRANTAVFYSISNCQTGLRGVSFGNFLIKQVVQELSRELPQLKTFVTLSPLPGFAGWVAGQSVDGLPDAASLDARTAAADLEPFKAQLLPLAARYLTEARREDGKLNDPVERFHLGNGARLEQINWAGDLSPRRLRDSYGLMVNYLYDPTYIVSNHEAFVKNGDVAVSSSVRKLARG